MRILKNRLAVGVKAKPIFQKHLVISMTLFITVVVLVIFGAAYYVIRSMNARVEQEVSWLSDTVAQQVSDHIEAMGNRGDHPSISDSAAWRQALSSYMDSQLQSVPALYYLILENLEGKVLAQSFKENVQPDEVELLRGGALKPRQPRSRQIELGGVTNAHLRVRDYGTPVRLDARSMGQLRLGISEKYLDQRMTTIRHEIYRRSIFLASGAVAIFTIIFFYVRWLVKRAQALEAQAQESDRLAYLGTLASGLAHEIRNPLSAMNLNIQMIEEEVQTTRPAHDELSQLFDRTKREIKRLERLATSFLNYTRPLPLESSAINLKEFLGDVCRDFESQLYSLRISFSFRDGGMTEALIRGDRDLLKQALLNILINAKDAVIASAQENRTIQVRLQESTSHYLIDIEDNGIGIPPENFNSIFEIFYSNKRGGTGLGLPIARQIIEHHGGHIEVKSQPNRSTCFTIFLPA